MPFREDKRIMIPVPFLRDKTVPEADIRTGASLFHIEENRT